MRNPFQNAKLFARDVNPEDYHKQAEGIERGHPAFVMSSSQLCTFAINGQKWKAGFEHEDSKSRGWGRLIDTMILQPDQFSKRYWLRPAVYVQSVLKCPKCGSITDSKQCRKCKVDREPTTREMPWNGNSTTCQQVIEEQSQGREVISEDTYAKATQACRVVRQRFDKYIALAWKQVWIVAEYHDAATGLIIPVKILIDILPYEDSWIPKSIPDFKTARTSDPKKWKYTIDAYRYHVQGAFYIDVARAAMPDRDFQDFRHIISENSHPWHCGWSCMSQEFLEDGRTLYRQALQEYAQSLSTGVWHDYRLAPGTLVMEGNCPVICPDESMRRRTLESLPEIEEPTAQSEDKFESFCAS